jgi:hypothetical protein
MSAPRIYQDANGNPCPLLHLIKEEPEWAENQILHRDKLETELAAVTSELDALKKDYGAVKSAWRKACEERDNLKAITSNPLSVRVNLLRGTIARPDDMHFEHDEHGLIASLKWAIDTLRENYKKSDERWMAENLALKNKPESTKGK